MHLTPTYSLGLVFLVFSVVLNLGTIYFMETSNKLIPFYTWKLAAIAISITGTQIFVAVASRNNAIPMDIAITAVITTVVLGAALIINYFDESRSISGKEWLCYSVMILAVFALGVIQYQKSTDGAVG